ncbi:Glutathione-specific gamma-glutamylcyclotransferase 1 [Halotydeus destructor]|nr:Glutathione-specific gamma-glutamylcyclotransferase 1 [Halotydeus destructor]
MDANEEQEVTNLWVFGYGSLIWKPGFAFIDTKIGYVKGYARKFYQGNDWHRGSKDKWGRVVTLIEEQEAVTWGRAFQLSDAKMAKEYLDNRESSLGGYANFFTLFQPRDPKEEPFPVLMYVAMPNNDMFLGEAPVHQMAQEIAEAEGNSGHNVEYLARLSAFMRLEVPHAYDDHLFQLDTLVKQRLLETTPHLLKYYDLTRTVIEQSDEISAPQLCSGRADRGLTKGGSELTASDSSLSLSDDHQDSQFADMVPDRKLRCLNI